MLRATVALALLLLTCVCSSPAPRHVEVTLIRDSFLGYDFGIGDKQAKGVVEGTRTVHVDVPDAAAEKAPEIILLENVNSGTGVALGAINVDFDKINSVKDQAISIKDQIFAGKNPFWRKK